MPPSGVFHHDDRPPTERIELLLHSAPTNEALPDGVLGEFVVGSCAAAPSLQGGRVVVITPAMARLLLRRWHLMRAMVNPSLPATIDGEVLWTQNTTPASSSN